MSKDVHKHTLTRAYQKTRNTNGPRYILLWVCKNCPEKYRVAYDLVEEIPR